MMQNGLQAVALGHGLRRGARLWSSAGQRELESLPLAGYTGTRRRQLQELRQELDQRLQQLDQAVREQAEQRAGARLLSSHPGVGPIDPQLLQQPQKPEHRSRRFQPDQHRLRQRGVKLPHRLAFVLQSPLDHFRRLAVHHRNGLLSRVQIVSYNLHLGLLRPQLWHFGQHAVYSDRREADFVMSSGTLGCAVL